MSEKNIREFQPPPAKPEPLRSAAAEPSSAESPKDDLLEKAKKDPIARPFLDIFPGPVSFESTSENSKINA
jgi:hypothetical protein